MDFYSPVKKEDQLPMLSFYFFSVSIRRHWTRWTNMPGTGIRLCLPQVAHMNRPSFPQVIHFSRGSLNQGKGRHGKPRNLNMLWLAPLTESIYALDRREPRLLYSCRSLTGEHTKSHPDQAVAPAGLAGQRGVRETLGGSP